MPPGLGTVRSDAGIFGGLGNSYWGGNVIPDGSPIIDNVYDLPQDQGGWVGIQYSIQFLIVLILDMILLDIHFGD